MMEYLSDGLILVEAVLELHPEFGCLAWVMLFLADLAPRSSCAQHLLM
jgi:hypothetical protein